MIRIPPDVEHWAEVIGDEPVMNLDVFNPIREDYKHLVEHQRGHEGRVKPLGCHPRPAAQTCRLLFADDGRNRMERVQHHIPAELRNVSAEQLASSGSSILISWNPTGTLSPIPRWKGAAAASSV